MSDDRGAVWRTHPCNGQQYAVDWHTDGNGWYYYLRAFPLTSPGRLIYQPP